MKRLIVLLVMVFATSPVLGADWKAGLPKADKLPAFLQDVSVTIKSENAEGSGVVKTRVMKVDNKDIRVNFVWTAAHVVDNLKTVKEVVDSKSGTKRQIVSFKDANVVKELVEDGRRVGELKMDAEVIKYSQEQDLALLKIRKLDFVQANVVFYQDKDIPPIGTDLYHVGSLLGQMGSNSMTSGIISQIGRTLDKREFDQSTATAFPGSSGGGLFLKNGPMAGAYVGMITRGAGEGFNLYIPVRRLADWAKKVKIEWAVNDDVPMPTVDDLKKVIVEDIGVEFTQDKAGVKPDAPPGTPTTASLIDKLPSVLIGSVRQPTPAVKSPQIEVTTRLR